MHQVQSILPLSKRPRAPAGDWRRAGPLLCLLFGFWIFGPLGSAAHQGQPLTAREVIDGVKAGRFSGRPIDLSLSNVRLDAVFAELERASGFRFDLDPAIQDRVTCSFRQTRWDEILARVLADHALRIDPNLEGNGFKVHRGAVYVLAFNHPLKARLAAFLYRHVVWIVVFAVLLPASIVAGIWLRRRNAARRLVARKPLLPPEKVEETRRRLHRLFEEDKVYLRENLSLRELAEQLAVTPHQLSWLVNDVMRTSFSSLVNGYRVAAARERLADRFVNSTSVLEIGLEVGFGTKAAFNRSFKKQTGMTPSEFRTASQRDAPLSRTG